MEDYEVMKPTEKMLSKIFKHQGLYVSENKDTYLLYDDKTDEYFGSFKANFETSDNKVYVLTYTPCYIDSSEVTDNPDELVDMISAFNDKRVAPAYCYNPYMPNCVKAFDTFKWYLSRYGFVYDPPCNQSDRAMTNEKHGFTVYLNYDQSEFSGEVWKDSNKGEQLVKIRFNSVESLVDALHTLVGDMPMIESTEKKASKSKKDMLKRLINELIDKFL